MPAANSRVGSGRRLLYSTLSGRCGDPPCPLALSRRRRVVLAFACVLGGMLSGRRGCSFVKQYSHCGFPVGVTLPRHFLGVALSHFLVGNRVGWLLPRCFTFLVPTRLYVFGLVTLPHSPLS